MGNHTIPPAALYDDNNEIDGVDTMAAVSTMHHTSALHRRVHPRAGLCAALDTIGTRNPTLQICYMFLGAPLNFLHLPTNRPRFQHTLVNTQPLLVVFVRMILGISTINSLNPNEKNMSAKWYIPKSTKDHHQIQLGV